MKIIKYNQTIVIIGIILSLLFPSLTNATTINELIDSFDYSYSNGAIDVTSKSDFMQDLNSNGINDNLAIQLTTQVNTQDNYKFLVSLIDNGKYYVRSEAKLMTPSDNLVTVNFPSDLFEGNKFNYTLEVFDSNNKLAYREYKTQTNEYLSYESTINIESVSELIVVGQFVWIRVTINSIEAVTKDITAILKYGNSTISKTEQWDLTSGTQIIPITFDDEMIKSTHHNGEFIIDRIIIGEKTFNFNQIANAFNYQDFAKTSYIKSITSKKIDSNNNNLSESLEISFELNIKNSGSYTINYELYDEFDNYAAAVSKTQSLSIGIQNIQSLINGQDIYKTKINGPYKVTFANLVLNDNTVDLMLDAHKTGEMFYTDFERPPQPDLTLNMDVTFANGQAAIDLNLTNDGDAPAFNVFLDIFSDLGFNGNGSTAFLDVGQTISYTFNAQNSQDTAIFTAIADFDNLVDENDETNNIVQNIEQEPPVTGAIDVKNLNVLESDFDLQTFEFTIHNNGENTVNDLGWQFDTGDNLIVSSSQNIAALNPNEEVIVILQHDYSNLGIYGIQAAASGLSNSNQIGDSESASIIVGDLEIISFTKLSTDKTKAIFELQAKNYLSQAINGISWSLDTGNQVINSNNQFNLNPAEIAFIYVEHDYLTNGNFNAIVKINNGVYEDYKVLEVNI
jgi:hypothetical protein